MDGHTTYSEGGPWSALPRAGRAAGGGRSCKGQKLVGLTQIRIKEQADAEGRQGLVLTEESSDEPTRGERSLTCYHLTF